MDVRNLIVDISAHDTATAAIENLNSIVESINKTIVSVQFDNSSLDNARKAYEDVAAKVSEPIKTAVAMDTSGINQSINDTLKSSNLLGSGFSNVGDKIKETSTLSEKLGGVWSTVGDIGKGMSGTINGVVDSINMASVAIGAVVAVGANKAFKEANLDDAINEVFQNESNLRVKEFLANAPAYVEKDVYAAGLIKSKERGIGLDESMKMLQTLSSVQFSNAGNWARQGRSVEGAQDMINQQAMYARSAIKAGKDVSNRVKLQLASWGFGEIDKKDIEAAYKELRAAGEVKGKTKDTDLDKIFRKAVLDKASQNIKPIDWGNLTDSQRLQVMQAKLSNLQDIIASAVIPVLSALIDKISMFIDLINKVPGGAQFIGYVTVFGTLAVLVSRLAGTFSVLATSIKGAGAAMAMYQKVTMGDASFIGAKKGLNAPLQRVGSALTGIGLAGESGLISKISASYKGAGGSIRGVFAAAAVGVKGSFAVMKTAALQFFTYLLANPLVAIGAIIVAIVLLAYKWGYLQRAWERFSKSNFGKDVISAFWTIKSIIWVIWEKMVSFLDLNFSGGVGALKGGFEFVANIINGIFTTFDELYTALKSGNLSLVFEKGGDLASSLGMISPMFYFISLIFRFIKAIYEFLKEPIAKMRDFLSWIYEVLSGLWSWLIKAIPGAEKSSLANDIAEQAAKEGLKFLETGEHAGEFKKRTPAGDWVLGGTPSSKLAGIVEKWKNTPGFAEGIADAVKKGISSIGDTIASKLKSALDGIFGEGTFDGVVSSLKEVATKLGEIIKEMVALFGGGDIVAKNDEVKIYRTDEAGKFKVVKVNDFWFDEGLGTMSSADIKSKYGLDAYASGTDYVPKTGPYILHQGEAVIPAALNKNMSSSNTSNFYNTFNFHKHGTSSGFDTKEKAELTKLIDDYISKQIRHRQGH